MRNVIYKCEDLWRNRYIGDAMFITDQSVPRIRRREE